MTGSKALQELCAAVVNAEGYDAAVERAADVLAEALGCACMIALLADDEQTLYPIGLHPSSNDGDAASNSVAGAPFESSRGYVGEALSAREPIIETAVKATGLGELGGLSEVMAPEDGDCSLLVVPMTGRTGPIGVIACVRSADGRPFGAEEIGISMVAAPVIALAVESALLTEALALAAGRRAMRPRWQPPHERPDVDRRKSSGIAGLSERERDVLTQLAGGYTNNETADRLALSVRTVEWHCARIQWKLGASSRVELIQMARAQGIDAPQP